MQGASPINYVLAWNKRGVNRIGIKLQAMYRKSVVSLTSAPDKPRSTLGTMAQSRHGFISLQRQELPSMRRLLFELSGSFFATRH